MHKQLTYPNTIKSKEAGEMHSKLRINLTSNLAANLISGEWKNHQPVNLPER